MNKNKKKKTVGPPLNTLGAYLKKSFLQYSFPSREKHFSVKVHLQSQHWTHLMCHGLSKTFNRNLSRIGFSQLAQWSIVSGDIPQPRVRDKGWTLALQRPRHLSVYLLEWDPGNPTHPNEFRTSGSTSLIWNAARLFHGSTIHMWPPAPSDR